MLEREITINNKEGLNSRPAAVFVQAANQFSSQILIKQGNCQVNKLHKQASRLVKAQAQSEMVQALEPHFTQEEEAVYKRGRNAKSYTTAKNATTGDYRRATGFEAVMGYLYLTDQYCRMIDLIKMGLEALKDGK